MPRPTLTEISAFCAVASHRSFRRAAEELGVTPSTLSHTINALEKELGLRLLHRTTRSVATTEAGEELRRRMEPLIRDFDTTLEDMRHFRETVAGTVRINAASPAIRPLLDRAMPALMRDYPDVHVDFVADGRLIDIVDQGFDAGIRFGDVVPKDMVGIPFGRPSRFVAVASPSYLEAFGIPRSPQDFGSHRCIRLRMSTGRLLEWTFAREGRVKTIEPAAWITFTDVPLQLEAAANGLGITQVWEDAAEALIERGALRIVLEDWAMPVGGLLLYYPRNRRTPPALQAFADVLRNASRR
jgi:DNA-binding transcriptional LysR family regulator